MIDYREILRLHSQNHSQRRIETSVHSSHQTVKAVLENAAKYGISWPLDDDMTNEKLDEILNNSAKKHGFIPYAEQEGRNTYLALERILRALLCKLR